MAYRLFPPHPPSNYYLPRQHYCGDNHFSTLSYPTLSVFAWLLFDAVGVIESHLTCRQRYVLPVPHVCQFLDST